MDSKFILTVTSIAFSTACGIGYAESLSNSTIGLDESTFNCQLSPIRFEFFTGDLENTSKVSISHGGETKEVLNTEVSIEGSGICRHRVWRFDYQGFTQVTELACYGEVDPPKTAAGYISFDQDAPHNKWFWCHL